MSQMNKNLYGDFFIDSHQKLAIQCTKSLNNVEDFMIGVNSLNCFKLFKIVHIISHKSHLVFSIEKNEANIKYLKNSYDKEFLIFTNDLYKHYEIHSYKNCKIEWIGFNGNDITITIIMNKNLHNGYFLDGYPKLAVGCTQTLCNVANFMIGYNLEILEITSGNSRVFSIEKNERNIKYLTDNFDKEFHIFVYSYLYKCYKIKGIRFNENDITIVVNEFDKFDIIVY